MRDLSQEFIASYYTLAGDVNPNDPSNIAAFPFRERVEAAAAVGFKGMGLAHADLMHNLNLIGEAEMKGILHNNGIRHLELEFVSDWFSVGHEREVSDQVRKDLLTAAESFGARVIKIGGRVGTSVVDMPHIIHDFRAFAEEAQKHGTKIAIEFMPYTNIINVDLALQIVKAADHPAGGIVADLWHFVRGGSKIEELRKVPGKFIFGVDINDASNKFFNSLSEDSINNRRFPGEGDQNPPGFMRKLHDQGYRGPWSVEVISEAQRQMGIKDVAQKAYQTAFLQYEIAFGNVFSEAAAH